MPPVPLGETQTHAVKGAPGQDEQIGQRAEVDMYHMSPPAFPGALALSASGGRGGAVRHDRLLWHDSDTGGAAGRIATAGAAAAASSVATPSGQATMARRASGRAGDGRRGGTTGGARLSRGRARAGAAV